MAGPKDDKAMAASLGKLRVETSSSVDTSIAGQENDGEYAIAEDLVVWGDDPESPDHESTLDREWIHRRNQFYKMGYRDGVTEGKKDAAQEGFNMGFRQSVTSGHKQGLVRGITSALGSLPESLKEKLLPDIKCREKLQDLHNSMQEISTDDALQMYNGTFQKADNPSEEPHLTSEEDGHARLRSLWKDLVLLLRDCPDIKVSEELARGS